MAKELIISIIDDDESVRSAVTALVRSAGYKAHSFVSADEFLASGPIKDFACIIADIQMPGMSGIELMQHLVAFQVQTPVILITALQETGIEKSALASGAVCFLRKPFDADELIDCLERALRT